MFTLNHLQWHTITFEWFCLPAKCKNVRTSNSFPLIILIASRLPLRFDKLLFFNSVKLEWENVNSLICGPFKKISDVRYFTERSKSYTINDWIGFDNNCSVDRMATAVALGHSKNMPVNKKDMLFLDEKQYCILNSYELNLCIEF